MSTYMQKTNFIPEIAFKIIRFEKSYNLIGRECFGLKIENLTCLGMRFLQNNKKDDGTLFGTEKRKKKKKNYFW